MPSGILWMAPLGYTILFSVLGLILALLGGCAKRQQFLWDAVRLLGLLAALSVMLMIGNLHFAAQALAAGGIAAVTSRFLERNSVRSLNWMRIGTAAMLAGLLTAAGLQKGLPSPSSTARTDLCRSHSPNVLLIVLDTVRADFLGWHGATPSPTPNLDRWSKYGVVFQRAYSTAPWTLPSTASMFTGRLPSELSADWFEKLDHQFPTLAEHLHQNGYETAGFVANTRYCGSEVGIARGFVHYEDYNPSLANIAMCTSLGRRFATSFLSCRVGCCDVPGRKTAATINKTFLGWLRRRDNRPYFAFLNYLDAHDPYIAPAPFRAHRPKNYQQRLQMRFWWWMNKDKVTPDVQQQNRNAHVDCIRYLDEQIGRLLDELDREGRLENTLVVITADHGEQFGEHGLYLHGNSLYNELVHVPLLMIWPQRVPSDIRITTDVSLVSLSATIAQLTTQGPSPFPGPSLAAAWEEHGDSEPRVIISQVMSPPEHAPCQGRSPIFRGSMSAVQEGRYKLIDNGDSHDELYDVLNDPKETRNLVNQPELRTITRRLRSLLES
jgi:arylsulfatase A-like enzyme